MDDSYRLKIKIGEHEFEAEGSASVVERQFTAFTDLIAKLPAAAASKPTETPIEPSSGGAPPKPTPDMAEQWRTMMPKIVRVDERVISLTVRPTSVEDAVLLLLLAQKILRENDAVTGGEIMEGLTATGGFSVARVDRLLEKAARDGDVIVIGERRAKRYRLTNSGNAKAREVAFGLFTIVA
jgi:hypothetical protein